MVTPVQARDVLNALQVKKPREFSSHDFIEEYCKQYETVYIDWSNVYRGTNRAFQTVHSQIGDYLSENEGELTPEYRRTHRADSENVHGTIDRPMWWEWV